ncbi:MAG: hypothetical protein AVDCRST_MAG56-1552 [uncultured Cytophagales bacterium]|uniref:Type I restriction enzyme R protein N-terminal domain-containing protein n=1 Tax=uncultured Cytophagales bacterium TaxID=158755 RepID=A0A6J4I7K3_9SPHI|nr:MAG: hypothetical protein AVDCRST_MAG56-1552 [uncultured Cytophagales bacterium]
MAYGDFTLEEIELRFGVRNRTGRLFPLVTPVEPGEKLKEALQLATELPVRSEKARSETIVFPLLVELRSRNNKFFTIYSGDVLNADEEKGLRGECDFILAKDIGSFSISYPIIQIVEAKKNDLEIGVPQCAAQLIGAQIFNRKKGVTLDKLYGCVTTGNEWMFMQLEQDLLIDPRVYYLNEINELLGVFQCIIDHYRQTIP